MISPQPDASARVDRPLNLPLVSVVVVNWNGRRYLDDCLASLEAQDYPRKEILFVDNGSTDGSVPYVKERFPRVRVIELGGNLGFAGANNIGMEAADGDIILLINNDTRALPGMLSAFVQAMNDDPLLGAAQGKIRFMQHPDLLDTGIGSFFTSSGFLMHVGHMEQDPGYRRPQRIFAGKGACLCLRRAALAKAGPFDPEFFAYFEDSDLCWRVWLAGYTVAYVPHAEILHWFGGSTDKVGFALINYHSFKNRIRALTKNLGAVRLATVLPIHLLFCVALIGVYAARRQPALARGIAVALLWNAQHAPATLRERRRVQRCVRRVSDAAIFRAAQRPMAIGRFLHLLRTYGGGTRHLHGPRTVEDSSIDAS